jgi:hypothetical protein
MLTGLLPGPIVNSQGQIINCKPVDLSANGLGILTSELLREGEELILKIPDRFIQLQVSWGKRDFGKQNLLRYGLVVEDANIDLEKVFQDSGCVK